MAYVPYEKMSKRKKRAEDQRKRENWGCISPVTRKAESATTYNRAKARRWQRNADGGLFCWTKGGRGGDGLRRPKGSALGEPGKGFALSKPMLRSRAGTSRFYINNALAPA